MSAFRAVPIVPGYGSAKAGLVTLTHNLADQWAGDGIRVNAIAPGVIETPMTAPMLDFPELLDRSWRTPRWVGWARRPRSRARSRSSPARPRATSPATTLAVDGGYLVV